MQEIDARKMECPKPVLRAKEAVDGGSVMVKIRVDNETAASNVTRFLEGRGFGVKRSGTAPDIAIEGKQMKADCEKNAGTSKDSSWSVLLLSDKIGAGSDGLGDVLMKAFLGTVAQSENPPLVIALMNDAVKMALEDRSTYDTLKELEQKCVPLLICGTCAKHFGITENIRIGTISNMFEITDAVFGTSKPIVIG